MAVYIKHDRTGLYLEVELPDWSFQIGKDPAVPEFLREEGDRMIREYGHHPSWVMLTMGNELKGDYQTLDQLVAHFRQVDPSLLYAGTTYPSSKRGKVPGPLDDYYISQDTPLGRVRGQDIFNDFPPNTVSNFDRAESCITVPLISHEVGQDCVYPHMAEIDKYSGILRPTAWEAIRRDLSSKKRLGESETYTHDSGELAALLYKEEIERALRSTNQAGFQLLALNDFPGQGTSTVGLFDSFWDGKGLLSAEQFRRFCGPVTPLLLLPKRVYRNTEPLDAAIEVANFGPTLLKDQPVQWSVFRGRKRIGGGSINSGEIPVGARPILGRLAQNLTSITQAWELKITVSLPEKALENDWSIWVYPDSESAPESDGVEIFETPGSAFYAALDSGKRVLLVPDEETAAHPLAVQFVTIFWNPIMFPNQPGTMGALIDKADPIFADFPTQPWTDWQWWELLHRGFALDLEALKVRPKAALRFVDKFNRNAFPAAIIEARAGRGRLVICTLDILHDLDQRIAARQLRRSILSYMASPAFHPGGQLTLAALHSLFKAHE